MARKRLTFACPVLLGLLLLALTSCRHSLLLSSDEPKDWPDLKPTELEYVDSEGFDALLENALVNQDPVIIIQTGRTKPDWEGRLNAWIAAWNRSNSSTRRPTRRASSEEEPIVRGQAPLPQVTVDGDSIREFRLLIAGLLDRVDEAAHNGVAWWAEERARSRRVALLKPYSLRFHKDEEELIQLVFFHGSYASYYPRHMQLLMRSGEMKEAKWSRSLECSGCIKQGRCERIDRLTNQEKTP